MQGSRFWPLADIELELANARFNGQSGRNTDMPLTTALTGYCRCVPAAPYSCLGDRNAERLHEVG